MSAYHRNSNLFSGVPENKSSPRVVTGKWLLKNYYKAQKQNLDQSTITNHKKAIKSDQVTDTTQTTRTHYFLFLFLSLHRAF
jgi:hypothetical protein